jgi:hypothetical protein
VSLWQAYTALYQQWRLACEIGALNRARRPADAAARAVAIDLQAPLSAAIAER